MSLDVYLITDHGTPVLNALAGRIFIREDGRNKEITREEWDERFPGQEPILLEEREGRGCVFESNITHNLVPMAKEAGLYEALWRPEEILLTGRAGELVRPLRDGLKMLLADRARLEQFNPENGWGDYVGLVEFTAAYLAACEQNPSARIAVSR